MNYATWEREVTDNLIQLIDCTNSDAQSIVEAQPFLVAKCWAKGVTPMITAKLIKVSDEQSQLEF